jgi:hypothetical protein
VAGVVGAVGEFAATSGETVCVEGKGDTIVARTSGTRLRFVIDGDVRALTFEPKETPLERARIVLAVGREQGCLPVAPVLTDLGPDREAIDPQDRDTRLFDLGLGRKEARFCVRCPPGPALDAITGTIGSAFPGNLLAESAACVIETALGRIEILTPIPPPGGRSPAGSHTHLLPDHLASGLAMPAGMDLPRAYLPGAIFYPAA